MRGMRALVLRQDRLRKNELVAQEETSLFLLLNSSS